LIHLGKSRLATQSGGVSNLRCRGRKLEKWGVKKKKRIKKGNRKAGLARGGETEETTY